MFRSWSGQISEGLAKRDREKDASVCAACVVLSAMENAPGAMPRLFTLLMALEARFHSAQLETWRPLMSTSLLGSLCSSLANSGCCDHQPI